MPVSTTENARGDFGWALKQLRNNELVRRRGWNGKGMSLVLVTQWRAQASIHGLVEHLKPWIGMVTADRGFVPWLASQTDLLANDWELAL